MKPARPTRRSSLLNRALVANIILVGISVACLVGIFLVTQRAVLQDQLEARAGLLAESLASQSELAMLVRNRPELERTAVTALASEDVLYVVMEDASGNVLAKAARPGFPLNAIPAKPRTGLASVTFDAPARIRSLSISASPSRRAAMPRCSTGSRPKRHAPVRALCALASPWPNSGSCSCVRWPMA